MNLDRLARYYREPSQLANHPFSELEELLQEFPFFTAGHLLLLKQYRLQNSSRYKKQHRKVLTLVPDPVQAFLFTEGDAWMPSGAESVPPDLLPQVDSGVLHTSSDPGECPSANPDAVPPVDGLQTDDSVECIIKNNTKKELLAEIGAIDTDGPEMERRMDGGGNSPPARDEGNGTDKEGVAEVEEMAVTAEMAGKAKVEEMAENSDLAGVSEVEEMADKSETAERVRVEEMADTVEMADLPSVVDQTEMAVKTIAARLEEVAGLTAANDTEDTPIRGGMEETGGNLDNDPAAAGPVGEGSEYTFVFSGVDANDSENFRSQAHELQDWFRYYAGKPAVDIPPVLPNSAEVDIDREIQLAASSDLLNAPSNPLFSGFVSPELESVRVMVKDEQKDTLSADAMHTIRKLAQASINDDQLPASVTLAEVFASQQEWDHAIAIYEQLILMNPEKMPIFAPRIEQLRQAKN
jgi:hypothetical protein